MASLFTKLVHLLAVVFGDPCLNKNGNRMMPCESCGTPFRSWAHHYYGSEVYDSKCEACVAREGAKQNGNRNI